MLGFFEMLAARGGGDIGTILWVVAVVCVIAGVIALVRRSVMVGLALIIIGFLIGPGGVSIFS